MFCPIMQWRKPQDSPHMNIGSYLWGETLRMLVGWQCLSLFISMGLQICVMGHILLVNNYLILALISMREWSNCRPIKYVHGLWVICGSKVPSQEAKLLQSDINFELHMLTCWTYLQTNFKANNVSDSMVKKEWYIYQWWLI